LNYPAIDEEAYSIFDRPNMTGTPERRLLLAILERALLDFVGNDQKEYEEAFDWIFNNVETDSPEEFSFPWVCSYLDLDLADIKAKIRVMPRRGASRIAPWYLTKGYKQPENQEQKPPMGKVIKFSAKPVNKKVPVYVS